MGVFSNRRKTRSRDRPDDAGKRSGAFPIWTILQNAIGSKELKGSEAVYAAVSRIANTLACMPMHFYRDYEIQREDPRERCVAYAPNSSMTPYNLKLAVETCRLIYGTGYILCVPAADGITVDHLDPIDPRRVTVLRNPDTKEIWYRITLDDGSTVTVHSMWMIVLHHMSTDGITGISPIEVLGGTLDYDRKVQEISVNQLEGFTDSIVLSFPSHMDSDLRVKRTEEFLKAYKSSRGHVIILDGGVTVDKIAGTMMDPKILDVDNITKRKVASVYNLPPRMLGDTSASGYSTSEQDRMEFLTLTMLPIVIQWEQAFDRKQVTYDEYCNGYGFRLDMEAVNRGDTDAMSSRHQKLARSGGLRPNEIRKENGYPPDPYGDELLISRDMVPLRVVVEHPELLLGGKMDAGDNSK